jgi:hypothetical protein
VKKYLATLNDTAWGAASDVVPKFVSPSDPAAQWTGAHKGPAFFAYSDNYLIDVKFGVIVDVEASRSIRQAEVGAAKTMIERTEERFGLKPERLAADTAYGAASMLNWLVEEKGIAPHIPVFDRSKRDDGTFSRSDFQYDPTGDVYYCPAGKIQDSTRSARSSSGYCAFLRRDRGVRTIKAGAQENRDAVRALEAYPEARSAQAAWPARSPGRVCSCRHRSEPATPRIAGRPAAAICGSVLCVA